MRQRTYQRVQAGDDRHQRNSAGLTRKLGFAPRPPIPVGTIPADIGNLVKLVGLDLRANDKLSGECTNGPISTSSPCDG